MTSPGASALARRTRALDSSTLTASPSAATVLQRVHIEPFPVKPCSSHTACDPPAAQAVDVLRDDERPAASRAARACVRRWVLRGGTPANHSQYALRGAYEEVNAQDRLEGNSALLSRSRAPREKSGIPGRGDTGAPENTVDGDLQSNPPGSKRRCSWWASR